MSESHEPDGARPLEEGASGASVPNDHPDGETPGAATDPGAGPTTANAPETGPEPTAASHPPAESSASPARAVPRVFRPLVRILRRIDRLPHPPWGSWQGMLLLFVLLAGFGAAATMTGVTVIGYSESVSFCTTCHTMEPEKKAYAVSPHSDVTCAECHVAPGALGFVKAKLAGTRELYALVTNTYPTPIPAIEHDKMPPVEETCEACHSVDQLTANGGPTKLIVRPLYASDEQNTRQTISVLLRPYDLGPTGGTRGVHWHIQEEMEYTSPDSADQTIDLVKMKAPDGTTREFIAADQIRISADVTKDVARLESTENNRSIDCISCHNRVGHEVPSPDKAVDQAMAAGTINATLPYIKRDAVAVIKGDYPTSAAADQAIDAIATTYQQKYPLVAKNQAADIAQAVSTIKSIYHLVATPQMGTLATTYPDNLGHQSSPGCFRCHDGAHYLIKDGQVTNEVIRSTCDTCHTFPQTGVSPSNIPIGLKPTDHDDALWVFDHKNVTSSVLPDPNTCGACHAPSYCENCHESGAIKVDHATMLYNHAESIRAAGGTNACAYCHQTSYCEQCHKDPVLGSSKAALGVQSGSGP